MFIITHIYKVIRKAIISLQVVLLALKSSISREVSACPRDPKASCSPHAKILLEALRTIRYMCNTFNSCLYSMAFQMMGIMEADFYYYKSGAALISKIQSGTPLSFTVTADTSSGKYSTKMNFKNLVIILL